MKPLPRADQLRQAQFWRKFHLLTRGRIDVLHTLEIMADEERDAEFRPVLDVLLQVVRAGRPLSEAWNTPPARCSRAVRELLLSAEHTGAWDDILPLIAAGLADGTLD